MDAGRATTGEGLRFAFGTLTVIPVRVARWDRAAAGRGMGCAPVVGLAVGAVAGLAGAALLVLGAGPLLAAVAAVAVPAALTRGLHLDGLADVADGLGSGRPADEALRIMKQSDIGPFGVLTLVLVLLAQVAALAELYGAGWPLGAAGALVAAVAARVALTLAARAGVPAARPDGLGAVVAGAVPGRTALLVAALAVVAMGVLDWRYGVAVVAASCVAEGLVRRCRARFGGVTGDVFGAAAESAATVALLALTLPLG
ncbi:adenosylcobinamide-GDP ribazoletransferase [Streptomyces sp. RKND-216]|uniref:adenosylcobinamide-GDP ribazoletransferase n=1 Tax=Streptomyces sp. RKND-216 TaxID=2562581 RepID=UPI00109DBDD0|nr:adenosylcobinamide-GDP ribazoletransferase [Streptomyces sp. RKND-216]THA26791.1 adenosylcobinamide-GDP ribazoletransferase [Streptomyces sp. RKND-216]